MVNLIVHLVREIKLWGPFFSVDVFDWVIHEVLKGYTKNQYRPEASIDERYVTEESIEFSSEYIETLKPVGLPQTCLDDKRWGKGTWGYNVVTMSQ